MPANGNNAQSCLAFLEAAYAWELDDQTWLQRLAENAVLIWGNRVWACAHEYDASDPDRFRIGAPVYVGNDPRAMEILGSCWRRKVPRRVARTFRTSCVGFSSAVGEMDPETAEAFTSIRTVDYFGINGNDPSGIGCFIGIGVERNSLSPAQVTLYQRLASHLGSAYRCRRRLRGQTIGELPHSEALIDRDGRVVDACGPAESPDALEAIAAAARAQAEVRRRSSVAEPTSDWRPRISGRWTLVDAFDHAGNRYIVARENQAHVEGLAILTEREREVVAAVAAGRSNKEIAYDLGISHATTRVLLSRAYRRLGVRTRDELFAHPSIRHLRAEAPANT